MSSEKIYPLETFRGVASWVVFLSHFSLAFVPPEFNSSLNSSKDFHMNAFNGSLAGTPLYIFINIYGATIFFFVLSGFVLTYKYFENQNLEILSKNATKRYFRFFLPLMIVVMISYFSNIYHLYFYSEVVSRNHSFWLSGLDNFKSSTNLYFTFTEALKLGAFNVFYFGHNALNPSLWSMRLEFVGSCIAFGLAPLLSRAKDNRSVAILLIVSGFVVASFGIYYLCFLAGVFIAYGRSRNMFSAITSRHKIFLTLFVIWIFSTKEFTFLSRLFYSASSWKDETSLLFFALGSSLLIILLQSDGRVPKIFSGRIGQFLGRISFPVYLLHVPIITTFSSWFYCYFYEKLSENILVTLLLFATILLLVFSAWLLSMIDMKWTRLVNSFF